MMKKILPTICLLASFNLFADSRVVSQDVLDGKAQYVVANGINYCTHPGTNLGLTLSKTSSVALSLVDLSKLDRTNKEIKPEYRAKYAYVKNVKNGSDTLEVYVRAAGDNTLFPQYVGLGDSTYYANKIEDLKNLAPSDELFSYMKYEEAGTTIFYCSKK